MAQEITAKKFTNNVIVSIAAQVVSMLVGFLMALLVPRFISELQYSYWQMYILYAGYVGVLHFGLLDGLVLRYSRYDFEELDKARIRSQFTVLLLFTGIIAVVGAVSFGIALGGEMRIIFALVAVSVVTKNLVTYGSYLFQITNRISKYAVLIICQRLVYGLVTALLLCLRVENFYWYCIADLIGDAVGIFIGVLFNRGLYFGKTLAYTETLKELKANISAGIILMLANWSAALLIGSAKIIIQWHWGELVFGKVSFAFSLSNVFLLFITAASVVFFPSLQRTEAKKLPAMYKTIRQAMSLLLFVVMIFYFPGCLFIDLWLPKYSVSLTYLGLLLPIIVFSSKVNLLTNNYLKVYRKEKWILLANAISIVVGILVFIFCALVLNNLTAVLISIVFVIMLNSIISEAFVMRTIKLRMALDFIVEILMAVGFMLIASLLPRWWGCLAYAGLLAVYCVFYRKAFKNLLSTVINTLRPKKKEVTMRYEKTKLDGVIVINPDVHGDDRGWFMETFRDDELRMQGITNAFVQDNQSFSAKKGTLRGIHYQNYPYAQSKLVRCLRGEILDVAVDLRSWSPNYKKWVSVVLSAENKKQLYIPRGFGHGFVTLTDDVEIAYKCDDYYNKASEGGVRYNDADIAVDWGVEEPILSDKDNNAPLLKDAVCNFGARILVTGANGQLGYEVVKLLASKGIECAGVDVQDFDITDEAAVNRYLEAYKPTAIVHCAAYTAVDKAEDDIAVCEKVNFIGTKNIAGYCAKHNLRLVHISTEYVYGDNGKNPLTETDPTNPLGVYARTKLEAEREAQKVADHIILRTSGVFGKHGNNFIKTMLKLAETKSELTVVDDEFGAPTYAVDLAQAIVALVFHRATGIFNISNEGECSWNELAKAVFERTGKKVTVNGISTEAYGSKAKRQLNSRMDKTKIYAIGIPVMPTWQNALDRYLEELLK